MRFFWLLIYFLIVAKGYSDASIAYSGTNTSIYRLDLTTGRTSTVVSSLPPMPNGIALINQGAAYFVNRTTTEAVYSLNLTNGFVDQISPSITGAGLHGIALSDQVTAYTAGITSNTFYRVNLTNGNVSTIATIPGATLTGAAFEMSVEVPTIAYVLGRSSNLIYRIDTTSGSVSTITPTPITGANLEDIALLNNTTAYVIGIAGGLYRVDLTTGASTLLTTLPANIAFIALANPSTAYIGNNNNGTNLYRVDLTTGTFSTLLTTGLGGADGLALVLQIGASGLSGNNLSFVNYLNANASQLVLPLFAFQSNIGSALETASPTRNAIFTFASQTTQLAFGQQVYDHLAGKRWRKAWQNPPMQASQSQTSTAQAPLNQNRCFADASDATLQSSESSSESDSLNIVQANVPAMILCRKVAQANVPAMLCKKEVHYSPWLGILGAYTHERSQHQTPSFDTGTGGFVLATDYYRDIHPAPLLGGGMAYAYTHVHEADDAGHANINQGALVLYGAWMEPKWYINWALWGGYYHAHNVREINLPGVVGGSAISNTHGWQLTPHLEVGYTYEDNWFGIEPFEMIDWVACWEEGFQEHGAGKLNMGQKDRFCSLLRNELGVRFNETLFYDWGTVTFREKGSYVYQKAFHTGVIRAFLVGSAGSFVVSTLTGAQNLGVVEFESLFVPANKKYPYGTISSQVELGSSYLSYQGTVTIGKDF